MSNRNQNYRNHCFFGLINIIINETNDIETISNIYIYDNETTHKISKNQLLKKLNLDNYYKCKNNNVHCTICFEDVKSSQFVRNLPCNHSFHKSCIDNWLYLSMHKYEDIKCPLCRHKIELNM